MTRNADLHERIRRRAAGFRVHERQLVPVPAFVFERLDGLARKLLFDGREVSLMTCMISGQAVIAPWQQDNPEWQVRRWLCRHADRHEVSL